MTDQVTDKPDAEKAPAEGQKMSLTKSQLDAMIAEAVGKAVKPLEEKATNNHALLAQQNADMTPAPEKGETFSRIVRAFAAERGNKRNAAEFAKEAWGERHPATLAFVKALGASAGSAGGFIVPPEYSTDIIDLLRNEAVVRRAGAVTMPMSGSMQVPKITTGASGAYVGENTNITKEQQTFGQLTLNAKKLASLVPISNDLLKTSNPSADTIVINDIVAGMAVTEDTAFIRNQGTEASPKGMRYWAATGNIETQTGTSSSQIEGDLKTLVSNLLSNNVRGMNQAWFMASRSYTHLWVLRDANGNLVFPELRVTDAGAPNGRLWGRPVFITESIPTNLSTNQSEVYLAAMGHCVIGEEQGIELAVSDTAAYHDGSSVVAAFSQDQTVIRAIAKHDFIVRYDAAVSVLTGVTWGA